MTANRLGFQEKYISAVGKTGEKDIKLIAEVFQAPELVCARTNLTVIKAGVYKIPIKLTSHADDGIVGLFDLKLEKSTSGVALRKQ